MSKFQPAKCLQVVPTCDVGCLCGAKANNTPPTQGTTVPVHQVSPGLGVGDKGSTLRLHTAEQTLPFAPERASGFEKTGETRPRPQFIQHPVTAAHQSWEGFPGGQPAPDPTTLGCHHPQLRFLKHFHCLPGILTHTTTLPGSRQHAHLHTPQHPGTYEMPQPVTKVAYQSHGALAKGSIRS